MRPLLPFFLATALPSLALDIQIDYTYDTANFFDTQEKRDTMEAVAKFYGDLLQDNLLRIDSSDFTSTSTWTATFTNPATGGTVQLSNPIIPEDTIIVYVGARNLSGNTRGRGGPGGFGASGPSSWLDRVLGRGQAGAEFRQADADLRTDIGLWGGSVTFDLDSNWNFSLEENQSGVEFLKIALHEMGHVLGLGPSDPWDNLLANGTFTGPASIASNGSAPPADSGHFQGDLDSPRYGSFGTSHGTPRPVLMLPSSTDNGSNFDVITDLDLAGLIDIGWEVAVPAPFEVLALSPAEASFQWPSSSFCSYRVRRTTDLQNPNGSSSLFTGDGSLQSWSDPSPAATAAFYQLEVTSNNALAKTKAVAQKKRQGDDESFETIEQAERFASGCYCQHPHEHDGHE